MSVKSKKIKEYSSIQEFSKHFFNNYQKEEKLKIEKSQEDLTFGKNLANELLQEIKEKIRAEV
jgi:predicted DNA binding CopG/RHH family protein